MIEALKPNPQHFLKLFILNPSEPLPVRDATRASLVMSQGFHFTSQEAIILVESLLNTSQSSHDGYAAELADMVLQSETSIRQKMITAAAMGNHHLLGFWIRNARESGYTISSQEVAHLYAESYDTWAQFNRESIRTSTSEQVLRSSTRSFSVLDSARVAILKRAAEDLAEEKSIMN